MRAAVIAVGALATVTACASDPPIARLMTSVSVKDARDLLTEAGADVRKIDFGPDGFTITAELSPERHVWFQGMNCKGADQALACTEFKISASWQLDTPAHAEALAKKLDYNYTSVSADGANLDLWRMDFTYGGITREHLRRTVLELLELRRQAESVVWPPAIEPAPVKPKQKSAAVTPAAHLTRLLDSW